ncbi:DUF4185 domain-containing protein [Mycolicibacterium houstonense]|uniref:DUF4185 domain-containing protein n=1 Tax=Mycolicibacterium houstonense TaxID=146021 RepID=UPI003F9CA7ED
MDSTKYIGRVGALAVALGIGTALTSGTGVAWADETGGDSGKAESSEASSPGPKKPGASTTPNRKDPLSKLSERVRKDIETGLDHVGDALKRTQTRVDESRTQLSGKTTKPPRKRSAVSTGKSDFKRPAPSTPATGETTSLPEPKSDDAERTPRPNPVATAIKEATENVTRRSRNAATTVATAVPAVDLPERSVVPTAAITATEPPEAPKIAAPPVVSALLGVAGLAPFGAGSTPVAPGQSPALWAMMAWTRREFERSINTTTKLVSVNDAASVVAEGDIRPMAAVTPNAAVQTDDLTPKPQVPKSLAEFTDKLGPVTGPGVTDHWYVAGTDLGIMWNSGYVDPTTGKAIIYTMFGDTYSGRGMTGDWRNNVLFRTSDTDLSDGLQFSGAVVSVGAKYPGDPAGVHDWYGTGGPAAGATQIIYDPGYDGLFGRTYTMIPTSAIAIRNDDGSYTQYATVMSVRTWDNPGSWTTNYSGIAYSTDGGKNWTVDPDTVRSSGWFRAGPAYVPGDEHFQQNALVMSDDPEDPYVYVYGTPSGRQGSAYVARVERDQLTNLDAYEYWAGEDAGVGQWVTGDPSAAVPVFGSSSTDLLPTLYKVADFFTFGLFTKIANGIWVGGLPTNGNVSEMSVQYNEYLGKYVVLYTDGGNNVVMRVSDSPQGEWSDTTTLVNNNLTSNSGMYAPMVHPMSGTDYFNKVDANGNVVEDNSQYLYYNLSYWGDYNVQLMRTDLASMKTVSV